MGDTKTGHACILTVVVTVFLTTMSRGELRPKCDYNIRLTGQEQYTFSIHNFTKVQSKDSQHEFSGVNRYCTVLITTDPDRRVVFDLTYAPRKRLNKLKPDVIPDTTTPTPSSISSSSPSPCHSDYVHVGNDVTRLDVEVMTSYKFCGFENVRHELVSRGNKMWMVFKTEGARPKELKLNVYSRTVVMCRPDEFTCSPVQCVSRDKVCDGTPDCANAHDEYCVTAVKDLANVPLSHTPSCFRCGDGTCISPRLPRYDLNWGRGLWYLCDGYPHCPDQWDERPDICLHLLRGKVDAVIQCVPSDLQLGHNQSVIMWAERRCDDVIDCHHGEDEMRCKDRDEGLPIAADSITMGFVIGFFIVILIISGFVIHRLCTSPLSTSSPTTDEPSSDDILLQSTMQSPDTITPSNPPTSTATTTTTTTDIRTTSRNKDRIRYRRQHHHRHRHHHQQQQQHHHQHWNKHQHPFDDDNHHHHHHNHLQYVTTTTADGYQTSNIATTNTNTTSSKQDNKDCKGKEQDKRDNKDRSKNPRKRKRQETGLVVFTTNRTTSAAEGKTFESFPGIGIGIDSGNGASSSSDDVFSSQNIISPSVPAYDDYNPYK